MFEKPVVKVGEVIAWEASSGRARRDMLQGLLDSLQSSRGGRTWLLACDFSEGGPWAGLNSFFESLLPEIQAVQPDLLRKHDYELLHVLPALKQSWSVRNPTLTDLARSQERVRNYPADRSHRIIHGLIDLLDAWKRDAQEPWTIICDGFDSASFTVRLFLRELMRRRGKKLDISLILGVEPGAGSGQQEHFDLGSRGPIFHMDLTGGDVPLERVDQAELEAAGLHLEQEVQQDRRKVETCVPELIRIWRLAGRPDKVAKWEVYALDAYDWLGFYEEAIQYGESARAYLKVTGSTERKLRWAIFVKLFMSYVALQRPEDARRLAEEDVLGRDIEPGENAQLHYLLSMLHSRFLADRNLSRGEDHLAKGFEDLKRAGLTEEEFHFQSVFNRNGLAMIRHFQGRYQEAIELCRKGYEELEAHLSPEKHRLHRSVLLFNLAQVYSVLGEQEEAIRHFTSAIEMDPNYSEYYNDRGSVYLKMEKLPEAYSDYRRAIELSPPYAEVQVNLGQCCRLMGELDQAVEAYSTALDLDPSRILALVGRGQCHEAEGRIHEAIADYSAALALDPRQWDVLASRAVLLYELEDLEGSLSDLNEAIRLAPRVADLYQNRAVALARQGRTAEAARDLEMYLALAPEAEDRTEVEARLRELDPMRNAQAVA